MPNLDQENEQEALYNQWLNFSSSSQWDRAYQCLCEMILRDPESPWIHYELGTACYHLKEYTKSESHYQKAITLDPDNAAPFQGLTYLYLAINRAGAADDHCRKALQLEPNDPDNWFLMTTLCINYDDAEEASRCLDKAQALSPYDSRIPILRTQLGTIDSAKVKLSPDEQIAGYRESLKIQPENDYTHLQIGLIELNERKDYAAAEASFREALRLDPEDTENQKALIAALRQQDPILRFLWAPYSVATTIFKWFAKLWDLKWPIIFLVFTWKIFLIGGFALFLVFFALFWPMAKAYEFLTLVEVHKKMGKLSLYKGPFAKIHRLSFRVRCLLFGGLFATFWSAMIWLYLREGASDHVQAASSLIITIAIFAMIGLGFFISVRDYFRNKKRRKQISQIASSPSEP